MARRNKKRERRLALKHIEHYFEQADAIFCEQQERAHHYVDLARKVAMRYNVPMPRKYKRKYCKHCYHYLRSGKNARVRTRNKTLVMYCKHCKRYTRVPFDR